MREYALQQTAILLHRLAAQLNRAAREVDPESIHDVRVATRRLSRCLRVFAPFYPDGSWRKIRHQLSALMAAAGAVRDCDIALELMGHARLSQRAAIVTHLKAERHSAGQNLRVEIRRWKHRDLLGKWKSRLEL